MQVDTNKTKKLVHSKKKQKDNKQLIKLGQTIIFKVLETLKFIEAILKPEYLRNINKFLYSNNGLTIHAQPQFDHEEILGCLKASDYSLIHKINLVQYNFDRKCIHIQLESIQNQIIVPIDYIKERYNSFSDSNTKITVQILKRIEQRNFELLKNSDPIGKCDWITHFMQDEMLPTSIYKLEWNNNKYKMELVYNQDYIKLVGVLPNIMIDAINQTKQIPQVDIVDDIQMWNDSSERFLNAHEKPVYIEYDTLIMTYEGIKIAVKVRQSYIQNFCLESESSTLFLKTSYKILNPSEEKLIFDKKRLFDNSIDYLNANKINDRNRISLSELLFDTNPDIKFKYKIQKNCGFRIKQKNECDFFSLLDSKQ